MDGISLESLSNPHFGLRNCLCASSLLLPPCLSSGAQGRSHGAQPPDHGPQGRNAGPSNRGDRYVSVIIFSPAFSTLHSLSYLPLAPQYLHARPPSSQVERPRARPIPSPTPPRTTTRPPRSAPGTRRPPPPPSPSGSTPARRRRTSPRTPPPPRLPPPWLPPPPLPTPP